MGNLLPQVFGRIRVSSCGRDLVSPLNSSRSMEVGELPAQIARL
jgi:hypothetical protein